MSRYLKQYSDKLYTNDLEEYSKLINQCYLTNKSEFNSTAFSKIYAEITRVLEKNLLQSGFITEMYAPKDDKNIKEHERAFFTVRNAKYIDTARQLIETVPQEFKKYLIAPLLSEVSVHANTSGVFKGFYKNTDTGIGQFGGKNKDALTRITGDIKIPFPVFSNYECECQVYCGDSNKICEKVSEVDLAYLDPPYNQHPYGSNYFMLNTVLNYEKPKLVSNVSGIPINWNRSQYNKKPSTYKTLSELIEKLKAKYIMISFNSEGFISLEEMTSLLKKHGKLYVLEINYNVFRGSRNLSNRDIHVKEYLYLLEKQTKGVKHVTQK